MYEKLTKALLCCGNTDTKKPDCEHCPMNGRLCVKRMLEGAADAITTLTAENTALQKHLDEVNDFEKAQSAQLLVKLGTLQVDLDRVTAQRDAAVERTKALCYLERCGICDADDGECDGCVSARRDYDDGGGL